MKYELALEFEDFSAVNMVEVMQHIQEITKNHPKDCEVTFKSLVAIKEASS